MIIAGLVLAGIAAISLLALPRLSASGQLNPVAAALASAQASGSYRFDGDLTQVTIPSATVANIGRSSRTDQFHMQGNANARSAGLQMQLWAGGSVADASTAIGVKVENGKTYVRQGNGEWQADAGVSTDAIAPQGDFMAFLKAVRDVQPGVTETRAGITFTRYTFQLDGPAFADWARDQMQAAMQRRGELPAGATLKPSSYYSNMTGDGELWVREDGLPLRQVLTLRFPEQSNESVHARISVTFSEWGAPPASAFAAMLGQLGADAAGVIQASLMLMALAAIGLLLRFHGARRVQRLVTAALIAVLAGGTPLDGLKQGQLLGTREARAASMEAARSEADAMKALRAENAAEKFIPNAGPMAAPDASAVGDAASVPNASAAALSALSAPAEQGLPTDNGTDTDGDGLTDFAEARIGTSPTEPDSDDDAIPDSNESKGFALGGKTWQLDAANTDSNNDGIADGAECWVTPPAATTPPNATPNCNLDSDADGTPDVLDADNDNDAVPDRIDLAPFTKGVSTYAEASPLRLTLNNLAPNVPAFVDFQLRPANANRLSLAFNVLDWPRDSEGQVTDIDGKTWADVAASQGRAAEANEAYGDMKLVPMLEIRIAGATTNLPPQSDLTPYNISVNDFATGVKAAYVPLNLITDERSGARVAFNARMRYLPAGNWPAPHEVRLVWAVQALVDVPCDPAAADAAQQGCAADGYIHNVPQVIQTYYDDWQLTGLSVSENHGTQTALIYEDPAADPNKKDDAALAALSIGLDNVFLGGRDADNDNARDITINEIARRFDSTANGAVPADARWGLDGNLNILRVLTRTYSSFDQASIFTAMTETTQLLTSAFDASWNADNTLKPTVMFAYENQSRALGLDNSLASGGYVAQSGTAITVDMQPASQPRASLNTQAGLKWSHFCREAGGAWQQCDGVTYWNELDTRYANAPGLPGDPVDADVTAGRLFIAKAYDISLSQGVNSMVQQDATIVSGRYSLATDSALESNIRAVSLGAAPVLVALGNQVIMARFVNQVPVTKQLGVTVRRLIAGKAGQLLLPKGFGTNLKVTTRVVRNATVALGLLAATIYLSTQGNLGAKIALRTIIISLQTVMSVIDPILTVMAWRNAISAAGAGAQTLSLTSSTEAIGVSKYAGAIGAAVAIGVVWGFFIYSMVNSKVSAFSPEFNKALAETIAATIYIIVLTLLSATVIGAILVGIVSVIDAVLTAVCELGGKRTAALRSVAGLGGACFTLGTTAVKGIAYFLYNYDLMIDTDRTDMVQTGSPNTRLADPNKGFIAGNELTLTLPITTLAVHKSPDAANGIYINFYLWLFSKDNLRSSTYQYSLTRPSPQDISVSRGQMTGAWQNMTQDRLYVRTPMYRGTANTTAGPVSNFQLQPGINQPATFYLNMGYALPAYECFGIPLIFGIYPIPVCYTRTFTGKSSTQVDTLKYDIFPATMDGFATLAARPSGGLALAWDAAFPVIADADGDGLIASVRGGIDPNDAAWDNDNDGLSDAYELERRAGGAPYSPIACDTDSDGLTDNQETRLGTNPGIADTDNDGLTDAREVWHEAFNPGTCVSTGQWAGGWDVTINAQTPFVIRVSSNPADPDIDADGINDLAEFQLANDPDPAKRVDTLGVPFNPNIPNAAPIAVFAESDRRFVAPGTSVLYTTTVIANNALAPSLLDVSAPAILGGAQPPVLLPFNPLTFSGVQTVTQQTTLALQTGVPAQQLALSSTVRARLAPTGASNLTWDPVVFNPLGNPTQLYNLMSVAASSPDRTDTFLAATVATSSTNRGGNGAVLANAIPGGQQRTLFTSGLDFLVTNFMGDNLPDVTCNNAGRCVTVWDLRQLAIAAGSIDGIRGVLQDSSGQSVANLNPVISFGDPIFASGFNPQVASDGTNFLVAYEFTPITTTVGVTKETYLRWVLYSPTGAQLNRGQSRIESNRTWPQNTAGVGLDVAWIGDRYRIVWKFIRDRFDYQLINVGDVNTSGNLLTPFVAPYSDEVIGDETGTPSIAYDPAQNYVLVAFKYPNADIWHYLTRGPNLFPVLSSQQLGRIGSSFNVASGGSKPYVAYNPTVNAFQISAGGRMHLVSTDFSNRNLAPFLTAFNNGDVPIACPLPKSVPVGDYRFEEAPGATTFVNSASVSGADVTCTAGNCPTAGYPGATDSSGLAAGTPASDYSIRFDASFGRLSLNNRLGSEFSVAFWYKGKFDPADPFRTDFAIGSNGDQGFGLRLSNMIDFFVGGTRATSNVSLLDNQWHYVVATRGSNGDLAVYVDGAPTPVASATGSATPIMGSTIDIGGNTPVVFFDNLQLYNTALSGSSVKALYDRTMQSYCAGVRNDRFFNWTKLNVYTPDTRGGKIVTSGGLTLTVDTNRPVSNIAGFSNGQYVKGNQTLIIGGNADDATSGVAGVEININNTGFVPANGAATWAYALAVSEGAYGLQTRATDIAGNVQLAGGGIGIIADGTAPNVTISGVSATPLVPARNANGIWSVALNGAAGDPAIGALPSSGVSRVEVRLVGQNGVLLGSGWQTATVAGGNWSVNYALPAGVQDPTGAYTLSVRAADNVGNLTLDEAVVATLQLDVAGPAAAFSAASSALTVISDTLTLSGVVSDTGSAGVDTLEIAFTPIERIAALPGDITSDQADAALNRTWLPVTLGQRGAGITQTTWTAQVPANLESEYQIDLRGADVLGNRLLTSGAWRGIIDTLAPRVTFTTRPTGATYTYRDQGRQIRMYAVQFTCAAADRYLKKSAFDCPGNRIRPPTQVFSTGTMLQSLFPDLTLRTALVNIYTQWMTTTQPVATTRACDTYGRCASATTNPQASSTTGPLLAALTSDVQAVPASQGALSLPNAVVIAPTDQGYAGSTTGAISVTVAAESAQPLREIVITLDGAVVTTLSFAQGDAVTETQRTVSIPVGAQGPHTVSARATDWAGTVQATEFPVAFVLDTQPPALTLDTDPLTISDTWQLGSDVLRFNGTASDAGSLASVQIKVGNLPFADAAFENGDWSTALPVFDPEGKTLSVTVRAMDFAGLVTEVSATLGTDLSAPDAPDTTLLTTPANPSSVNNATVTFTGTSTTRDVVAFECQLDNAAFAPCSSPFDLAGLANGARTLNVRAVDSAGFVDLTPASTTWTVDVPALRATITSAPSNPSTRRSDGFSFTGDAGATRFECALDGAAFAPCSSPIFYDNLADGEHVFLVRSLDGNGNAGAPARYAWTVLNAAPVASSQAISTEESTPVAITLVATDTDAITFRINPPARGVVQGVPPNVTYTPDTGFSGVDSFTFIASDGLADSMPATVSITVRPRDNTPPTSAITLNPAAPNGQNGWYTLAVRAAVTATDGTDPRASGVAETRCTLNPSLIPAAFAAMPVGCAFLGTGADIAGDRVHVLVAASVDRAGNTERPISQTVRIDATPPVIAVTGVVSGAIYPLGSVPAAGCSTSDATSGVAVSSTMSLSGGNLHGVGRYNAGCSSATDNAGNVRQGVNAPYTVTYNINRFAVLAQEGVALDLGTTVTGSVGARVVSAGPFIANNAEVSLGQDVNVISPTQFVLGNRLWAGFRARVPNPGYNTLSNNGAFVSGAVATPFTPTLMPALPALPAITAGTQPINVAQYARATIAAGSYGAFTANQFAVITLTGGVYQFASWSIGQYVRIVFTAPTEVRIAGRLAVDQFANIGPATAGLRARDIVLFVAGINGATGTLSATPRAAAIGQYTTLAANVVVPNGTLQTQQFVNMTGAFFGRWVQIGQYSRLSLDGRFASSPVLPGGMTAQNVNAEETATRVVGAIPSASPAPATFLPNNLYLPLVAGGTDAMVAPAAEAPTGAGEVVIEPGEVPADAPMFVPPPDPDAMPGEVPMEFGETMPTSTPTPSEQP
jgi:hypothetical protein